MPEAAHGSYTKGKKWWHRISWQVQKMWTLFSIQTLHYEKEHKLDDGTHFDTIMCRNPTMIELVINAMKEDGTQAKTSVILEKDDVKDLIEYLVDCLSWMEIDKEKLEARLKREEMEIKIRELYGDVNHLEKCYK